MGRVKQHTKRDAYDNGSEYALLEGLRMQKKRNINEVKQGF